MNFSSLKNITLVALAMLVATSCDDFLDRKPVDAVSDETFFDSEDNAEAAVLGSYRTMTNSYFYGQTAIVIPEFAAGNLRHISNFAEYVEYGEHRVLITNPWALNLWTACYATINAANNIILRVPEVPVFSTEQARTNLINEAKFLRAITYFTLVRSFGDVPLVLEPISEPDTEQLNVSRSTVDQIYGQIISDLTEATTLPNAYASVENTKGRATGYGAQALLSKVHLYRGSYGEAATLAKQVIDNGGFALASDFSSIWLNENSTESIFELQFDAQATNLLASNSNPLSTQLFFAQKSTNDIFEDDDARKAFTINPVPKATDTTYYIGKYRNFNPATQNVPIIRLSELYLIYAEAQARATGSVTGDPYTYYTMVRERAGLTSEPDATFDVTSFVREVQFEKRREMLFEGETWYDFARTGLATEVFNVPEEGRFIWPIPQIQRDLDPNLTQNDAYL